MNKKILVLLPLILILAGWLTGCSKTRAPISSIKESKTQVVATIFPLADIARNIGGDKVKVITVIPAGASPHTFEVTPGQAKQFTGARVFIKVGAGLDTFADKLIEPADPGLTTVTVTEGVYLLESLHEHEGEHSAEGEQFENDVQHETKEEDHHHGNKDPHIWLDPVLVKEHIAPQIAAALAGVSPENAPYFQDNLRKYCAELDLLHEEIAEKTAKLPHRTFIALHSAWCYFSRRYGLEDIVVEEFPGKEPSARWIAGVIDTARDKGAKAILVEPQFSSKAAEVIAAEFGVPVLTVDPLGSENTPGHDSYLNMMRSNLKVLEQALR